MRSAGTHTRHTASLQQLPGGMDTDMHTLLDPNDLQQLITTNCLRYDSQATTSHTAAASTGITSTAAQGAIRSTSGCGWLTLVPLRALPPGGPEAALLLNGLASLSRHGGGAPLLACGTEQALGSCRKLGLACYNATGLHDSSEGSEVEAGPPPVSNSSLRVAVARRVLELLPEGAILHVTSPDTVGGATSSACVQHSCPFVCTAASGMCTSGQEHPALYLSKGPPVLPIPSSYVTASPLQTCIAPPRTSHRRCNLPCLLAHPGPCPSHPLGSCQLLVGTAPCFPPPPPGVHQPGGPHRAAAVHGAAGGPGRRVLGLRAT